MVNLISWGLPAPPPALWLAHEPHGGLWRALWSASAKLQRRMVQCFYQHYPYREFLKEGYYRIFLEELLKREGSFSSHAGSLPLMRGNKTGGRTNAGWWRKRGQMGEPLQHDFHHCLQPCAEDGCSGLGWALHQYHQYHQFVCLLAVPWLCCSVNPSGMASCKAIFLAQAVIEIHVSPCPLCWRRALKKDLESICKQSTSAVVMLRVYTGQVPGERLMKKLECYHAGQLLNRFTH